MREIKFRGWDAEGRKGWVYGDLVHNKKCNKTEPFLTDRVMVGGYEVVPESVQQYTGVVDSKGRKIFEGDTLTDGKKVGEVIFSNGCFLVDFDGDWVVIEDNMTIV